MREFCSQTKTTTTRCKKCNKDATNLHYCQACEAYSCVTCADEYKALFCDAGRTCALCVTVLCVVCHDQHQKEGISYCTQCFDTWVMRLGMRGQHDCHCTVCNPSQ